MNWTGTNARLQSNAKLELEHQKTFFSKQRLKLKFGPTLTHTPKLITTPVIVDPIVNSTSHIPGHCSGESKKKHRLKSKRPHREVAEPPIKRQKSHENVLNPALSTRNKQHYDEDTSQVDVAETSQEHENISVDEDDDKQPQQYSKLNGDAATSMPPRNDGNSDPIAGLNVTVPPANHVEERLQALETILKHMRLETEYLKRDLRDLTERFRVHEDRIVPE